MKLTLLFYFIRSSSTKDQRASFTKEKIARQNLLSWAAIDDFVM